MGEKDWEVFLDSVQNWKASSWYNSLWPSSFGEETSSKYSCFHLMLQHYLFHSKMQEPKGREMICVTYDSKQLRDKSSCFQCHHPQRWEPFLASSRLVQALPGPTLWLSHIPACHLSRCIQTLCIYPPPMEYNFFKIKVVFNPCNFSPQNSFQ